ncbi:MAG: CBS domain-containing protein [Chloroflexi bacterium]|nr:CBS domain-containing protein [Chloroflexota bacterium]
MWTAGPRVGAINDGDLVARVRPESRPGVLAALRRREAVRVENPVTAADLMSGGVLSGPPDTPIPEAIRLMLAERRKRFVVVDDRGRPPGMVDRTMLLRAVIGPAGPLSDQS